MHTSQFLPILPTVFLFSCYRNWYLHRLLWKSRTTDQRPLFLYSFVFVKRSPNCERTTFAKGPRNLNYDTWKKGVQFNDSFCPFFLETRAKNLQCCHSKGSIYNRTKEWMRYLKQGKFKKSKYVLENWQAKRV